MAYVFDQIIKQTYWLTSHLTEQKMSSLAPFKTLVALGVTLHQLDNFLKQNTKVTQRLSETEKYLEGREVKIRYDNVY